MRLNKKGFMMAEVVVVSFIVMGILLSIYSSYSSVIRKYNKIMDYYNIDYIYELASIRDELIRNEYLDTNILPEVRNQNCLYLENEKIFVSLITDEGFECVKNKANRKTMEDYLTYLKNSANLNDSNYVMIIERSKSDDSDTCYYNYLGLE